jgi:DNA segregation ATPase FtsK/SpoIIIE, S-DNA-T family
MLQTSHTRLNLNPAVRTAVLTNAMTSTNGMAGPAVDRLNLSTMMPPELQSESSRDVTSPDATAGHPPAKLPIMAIVPPAVDAEPISLASAPTARDIQRQTLGELVRLATECTTLDAQIEKQFLETSAKAEKQLKLKAADLTTASLDELSVAQHARNQDLAAIDSAFKAEQRDLEQQATVERRRVASEYEDASRRIKKDYQDATWLVESILDTAVLEAKKAHKATSERINTDRTAADEQRDAGLATLHRYGQQHLANVLADLPPAPEVDSTTFALAMPELKAKVEALDNLTLARLFVGVWPYLAAVAFIGASAAIMQPWVNVPNKDWMPTVYVVGGAVLAVCVIGFLLFRTSVKQIRETWLEAVDALSRVYASLDRQLAEADLLRDQTISNAQDQQDEETLKVKERFEPMLERVKRKRDEQNGNIARVLAEELARRTQNREVRLHQTRRRHEAGIKSMEMGRDSSISAATADRDRTVGDARTRHDAARSEIVERWNGGLAMTRAQNAIQSAPGSTRIGTLTIDLGRIADESGARSTDQRLKPPPPYDVPAWLSLPRQASLLIEHDRAKRDDAIELLRATMFNLLSTIPAGRVKFTLIDPVGLGQSFAAFMHLADHDDALVGGRIWSESGQIEQRLQDLTEHMETVIQKYLRNEFHTIDEYNAQAGELAEPYRFLVIADLPTSFTDEALRRLANIATTGARCGVYVLVTRDNRVSLGGTLLEDLRNSCTTLQQKADRFQWHDEVFGRFAFTPAARPNDDAMTQQLHAIGVKAKENNRIEVPFEIVTPKANELWSLDASHDIAVPVGRTGATRLQTFRLGRGVAQHALIAGKTGSGKSTLLNVLITNLAMWYSPAELEFYLIDFKRGVEFKAYATNRLPHARAIAVESDREFGLSVLQRLDAEIGRRGELYRKVGAQDVASYRRSSPGVSLPRIMLIVDEFQELFTEDDRVSQESSLLIDRLVRQGRAFGIHVVLGSQTIGGPNTLPRTTMGQMAVRVALQTTEADSQLILGDNNSAARLLTRPGEAIYNDAGGAVENNSPFQISWLNDDERNAALQRVRKIADQLSLQTSSVSVFEGNAPAHIEENRELGAQLAQRPTLTKSPNVVAAALGEAVAIKPPTAVALRKRPGSNVLILGQQDEQALAVLATMALSITAQTPADDTRFLVLDATPADSALHGKLAAVVTALPVRADDVGYRDVPQTIIKLAEELRSRQASGDTSPSTYVLINGLQRYRELRKTEESFSFSMSASDDAAPKAQAADKAFAELLKDGPSFGIHILAWCDTVAALDRTFDRPMLREFDNRVLFQMSAADSAFLIDSPAANKLGFYRAIYFSEEQGVIEKFRPYGVPGMGFVKERFPGA